MVGLLRRRHRVVMAAAAAVALLAGVLTGVQIRAAQAAERREDVAAVEAAAAAEAELKADQEAARVARVEIVLSWATAAQAARPALAAAEAALVASEAKVADDAVRQALAVIVAALHAALDDPPETPTADDVAALADLTTQAVPATTLVTDAQTAWQAEQDAAAAAAVAAPPRSSARGWPYDGAAPDCGSPASYEPSQGGTFHTSVPTETGDGTNGNIPRSAMTPLAWCTDALGNQQWLRSDAAAAMTQLNEAFRAAFGENIAIDLSYRSYADQVAAREAFGSLAARPGTSNHGWGLAIDTWEWAEYDFGTPRYQWLVANGPTYGWISPSAQDSSNPEYWHFEYTP